MLKGFHDDGIIWDSILPLRAVVQRVAASVVANQIQRRSG